MGVEGENLEIAKERLLIEDALSAAERALERASRTSDVRELGAKVDRFRRSLERWSQVAPSEEQRRALRDLALGLKDDVRFALREAITPVEGIPSAKPSSAPPSVPPVNVSPLVVIVDDDADTREWIRLLLEDEGFVVEEASNGHEALARLGRHPLPSLVLLDLMMPVMDGATLLSSVAALPELAGLPIIVTTAASIDEPTSTLDVPLLRKPFDAESLLRIVEQYAPRLWDDDEPVTEQTGIPSYEVVSTASDTTRQICVVCNGVGQTRCTGCGEAYCRACIDAGPSGVCAACWRRGQSLGA